MYWKADDPRIAPGVNAGMGYAEAMGVARTTTKTTMTTPTGTRAA
jgi:hypothetical protein